MCSKKELEMYLNFRNHIDRLFFPKFSEECEIVGAYEGEKEIGFLCVINGYIEGIWVEPEHRRRGKAKQMVFDYISKYGIPSRLHILNNNIPAQKFWNSIFNLRKIEETNIDILYRIIGLKEMESDWMRIYISGPITNDPEYYNKFEKVAYELVEMGYKVINPAELINVMPEDASHKEYMNICIQLLEIADTIVMLPGWEMSKGACIEYGYALASDMNIIEWEYLRGGKDEQINNKQRSI